MPEDAVIAAIADASRRAILDSLRRRDGQTVSELGTQLPRLGRHAVLKHLAVLEHSQLITTVKVGRHRHCYLNPVPLVELAGRWLDDYGVGWGLALSRLRDHLDSQGAPVPNAPRHVHRIVIAAPAERVWRALTDPQESAVWYYGTGVTSTWATGAPYTYRFPDGRIAIEGIIEQVDPPRRLVMTFAARWSGAVAADPPSRVTWDIATEGGLSTVTVTHEEVAVDSATAAHVVTGWPFLLSNVKTFVETGEPMSR
ncbi:ArsR/SmtB family transcription factor [Micromonospora sp. LOL_025]|uniref:ArsR/SmtB family transcription factor n=1 Tax=Micromonospora sp. LOL_025 TaxID=3345413 RepID=UPI003A872CE9